MTDPLLKLATWPSPDFPVCAFSYSHGLERAVADGSVWVRKTAQSWIESCLRCVAGRSDAILLGHAMRGEGIAELDDLARALAPTKERLLETEAQGTAFVATVGAVWGGNPMIWVYPVAVGVAARAQSCPKRETLTFYLQAFVSNLVSACIRLVPLGQTEGQQIIAALHPTIAGVADEASLAFLDKSADVR